MDNQEESLRNSSSCTALLDSVHVSISNGKMLTKNIMNSDNWESEIVGGRKPKEYCRFIITANDIQ